MGHGGSRRRARAVALIAAVVAIAAACQPIRFDTDTGQVDSKAVWRAVPTTIEADGQTHDVIAVRIRNCDEVERSDGTTVSMRPVVRVSEQNSDPTQADIILFDNETLPATDASGHSTVSDSADDVDVVTNGIDDVVWNPTYRLTIDAGCTTSSGTGDEAFATWWFDTCTTTVAERTCPSSTAGHWDGGDWRLGSTAAVDLGGREVRRVAHDGTHFVVGHADDAADAYGNQPLYLYDRSTGTESLIGSGAGPVISPDGAVVVYSVVGEYPASTLKVWDATTGQTTTITDASTYWYPNAISADNRTVIYGTNTGLPPYPDFGPSYAYDRTTGETSSVDQETKDQILFVSGDGRYVMISLITSRGDQQLLTLLDRTTGTSTAIDGTESKGRNGLGLSEDGRYALYKVGTSIDSVGYPATWSVRLYDRTTGTTETIGPEAAASSATMSADGRYVAYVDHGVVLLDRTTGRANRISGAGSPVTVSDDGDQVLIRHGAEIWTPTATYSVWDRQG